jgi:hypothetical protein
MNRFRILTGMLMIPAVLSAQNFNGSTALSADEQQQLQQRLTNFYSHKDDPSQMDYRPPKYSINQGKFTHPHASLNGNRALLSDARDTSTAADPLYTFAGFKADTQFQQYECDNFIKEHFPGMACGPTGGKGSHHQKPTHGDGDSGSTVPVVPIRPMAAIESNDLVANLVAGWMQPGEVVGDMASFPQQGQITQDIWSGDYWEMRWGLTSYRPSTHQQYDTYQQAVAAYSQPAEWTGLLSALAPDAMSQEMTQWSPAEKYDVSVGDTAFTLTNEQKGEGADSEDSKGIVPDWIGLCDGWSAASILVPAPINPVKAVVPGGMTVTWYPDEVRAMATLSWANGAYDSNFISGRCEQTANPTDTDDPPIARYPNGRLSDQDCFDTNPATFHMALANMIGKKNLPFIMDVSFDSEVWNQPVLSYQFQYFNPTDPTKQNADWSQVAIAYDAAFKQQDRFQNPLTRGVRNTTANTYDDSKVQKIVGVNATVVYLDEANPHFGSASAPNNTERVVYSYDLELVQQGNQWVPTGGEWLSNDHPDFLWVPKKGSVATGQDDDPSLTYRADAGPTPNVTKTAVTSSGDAFPLCEVLASLVNKSSDPNNPVGPYQCFQAE